MVSRSLSLCEKEWAVGRIAVLVTDKRRQQAAASTSFVSVPTGASNISAATPPEIEQTRTMLTGHRSVLGYMVLSRGGVVSIIRHSGVVFEGDQGKKYAGVIARIVDSVQTGLEEISGEQNEGVGSPGLGAGEC